MEQLERDFRALAPAVDFCSLRYVREWGQTLTVRQDRPQPVQQSDDAGVMLLVMHGGGIGYAATADLSLAGVKDALDRARRWASLSAGRAVVDFRKIRLPHPQGEFCGPERVPWTSVPLGAKFDVLYAQSRALKTGDAIVDWEASVQVAVRETLYLTAGGGRVYQRASEVLPYLRATASRGGGSQSRSFGNLRERCRLGGWEVLDDVGFRDAPAWIAAEALQLLEAPNCPSGRMDLLLAPDQLFLQIHESMGHALELDRILGDERNFAGTSFVTIDMIGKYRYGSDMLNVTSDPSVRAEVGSAAFDDEGAPAERKEIIRRGMLLRPLGGLTSQIRAGLDGAACCRACSWNRPPVDRMGGNLNLEPGGSTIDEMIAGTERGVYMKTNNCYSIDDSRNKFQFGCEWGRLIEDGRLTTVVRNPNYRGISATFWRNLKMVGDAGTVEILGSSCGKGEPYQELYVGHACPAALFANVDVFGGA